MKKIQRISHLLQQSDAENVAHLNGDGRKSLTSPPVLGKWTTTNGGKQLNGKGTQERQKHARKPGSETTDWNSHGISILNQSTKRKKEGSGQPAS